MSTMYFDSNDYLFPSSPDGKPASMHDSARGSPEPVPLEEQEALDGFQQLVGDINNILGPCNGIDSAGVDVGELKFVLRDYKSNESEWSKYAFADYSRAYTRNLVDRGNGKCNLVSTAIAIFSARVKAIWTLLFVWSFVEVLWIYIFPHGCMLHVAFVRVC